MLIWVTIKKLLPTSILGMPYVTPCEWSTSTLRKQGGVFLVAQISGGLAFGKYLAVCIPDVCTLPNHTPVFGITPAGKLPHTGIEHCNTHLEQKVEFRNTSLHGLPQNFCLFTTSCTECIR